MRKLKSIWFQNGENGYTVGKVGVQSISQFDQNGSSGHYPWFRVVVEYNKKTFIREVNSLFVEEVVYERENCDSTSEERRTINTEEADN